MVIVLEILLVFLQEIDVYFLAKEIRQVLSPSVVDLDVHSLWNPKVFRRILRGIAIWLLITTDNLLLQPIAAGTGG